MKSFLILEDGTVFEGEHFGAKKETVAEIVFNTSMTGYPEVLTDPSYAGQSVCFTYPLIGNYGISLGDLESDRPWVSGVIVREYCSVPSNFRSDISFPKYLEQNGIPGIAGIDIRALTKMLREKGTMNGMITTNADFVMDEVIAKLKAYTTGRVVEKVCCREKYTVRGSVSIEENGPIAGSSVFNAESYESWLAGESDAKEMNPSTIKELNGRGLRIALLDVGTKKNIIRCLAQRGCDVTVYPALTTAEEILADDPDGIMISNGPGDPKECTAVISQIRKLLNCGVPMFCICLGHQLTALAAGGDTHKLKYGHRGANHPVKDLTTGRVYISSQNHGYVVDPETLSEDVAEPLFVNVNDGTNEGLQYKGRNIFTVQFHPEACSGPLDSGYLFDRFIENIRRS